MAFVEMEKSRRIVQTQQGVTVLRFFHGPKSDLSAGAGGYTGSGIPAIGTECTWTSATWTAFTTSPMYDSVDLDPRSTKATAIVKVTATAMRAWAD